MSLNPVELAVRFAITVHVTPSADRSSLKPDSSEALSIQVRLMMLSLVAVAVRLVGALGTMGAGPLTVPDCLKLETVDEVFVMERLVSAEPAIPIG